MRPARKACSFYLLPHEAEFREQKNKRWTDTSLPTAAPHSPRKPQAMTQAVTPPGKSVSEAC